MTYLIIWIVLQIMGVGFVMAKHGEPRDNYNFWVYIFSAIIDWWLLYKAGLFDILIK